MFNNIIMVIFYLYSGNKMCKSFSQLNDVVSYISSNHKDDWELYVEEYDDDVDKNGTRTLLYKNKSFQIKDIFDYY